MTQEELLDLFKIVALMQGAFILGISLVIFWYYFRRALRSVAMNMHVLMVVASYICITTCTIVTVNREVYSTEDWWYWLLAIGYILGDVALLIMFKYQIDKHARQKIEQEIAAKKEAIYSQANAKRGGADLAKREDSPPDAL
jgi:amino acid transporter